MKRLLLWLALLVVAVLTLVALSKRQRILVRDVYTGMSDDAQFLERRDIQDGSWQRVAVDWVLVHLGMTGRPQERVEDLGMVDARQVPFLADRAVVAELGRHQKSAVEVVVGGNSAQEDEVARRENHLARHYAFTARVRIYTRNRDLKHDLYVTFLFAGADGLIAIRTNEPNAHTVVVESSAPGEAARWEQVSPTGPTP